MDQGHYSQIEKNLRDVPRGTLKIVQNFKKPTETSLFMDSFQAQTNGKGKMAVYQVYPGVQLSLNYYLAEQAAFCHTPDSHILEIHHCQTGRIGWNFKSGTSVYLGAGDLSLHSMDCCADSVMLFPLGYCESIAVFINLDELEKHPLPIFQDTSLDLEYLSHTFCRPDKSIALPSSADIDAVFRPLYLLPEKFRLPYFKLKVQELLLYLWRLDPKQTGLTQYCSRQTALIKDIHTQLTEHLDHRYTIEELSKQYLINTSSLKALFKGVYGLPIATYMKEYRIRKSMELLRQTDFTIAEIASRVGYGTQGKFTKAFKETAKVLPSEYRKYYR